MQLDPFIGIALGVVKQVRPGEVVLAFPWLNDTYRTDWTSVAMPLAGPDRGFFSMPELEDEVVVCFAHGNFDHPYVLGSLWNGKDKPPESEVKNRVFLTPGKNTLRFEDTEGKQKVVLRSAGEHSVEIDDAAGTLTVTTKGKLTIKLDDKAASIEISGGGRTVKMANAQFQIT